MNRRWTARLVCILSVSGLAISCSDRNGIDQSHELKPTGVLETEGHTDNSDSVSNESEDLGSTGSDKSGLDSNDVANGLHTRELLEANLMDRIVKGMPPNRGYFFENDPLTATVRWGTTSQIMFMVSKGYKFVSMGDNDDPGHCVYEVAVEKNDPELMRLLLEAFGIPGNDILTVLFNKSIDLDRVSIVRLMLERETWRAAIFQTYDPYLPDGGGGVGDRNTDQRSVDRVQYLETNGSEEMKALIRSFR